MAYFLTNICKFDSCGLVFSTLHELIKHIECNHIDFDPCTMKQLELEKPESLPLSYVLPHTMDDEFHKDEDEDDDDDDDDDNDNDNQNHHHNNEKLMCVGSILNVVEKNVALQHHNYSMTSLNQITSDSENDDCDMINEWKDPDDFDMIMEEEEFTSEFIIRYGSKQCGDENSEKPFACPVPGCKKRYKNVNGIKYHAKNGHNKNGKQNKCYKCHCGKNYKTAQGLKNHVIAAHNNSEVILPETSTLPQSIDNMSLTHIACLPSNFNGFYDIADDCMYEMTNGNSIVQQGFDGQLQGIFVTDTFSTSFNTSCFNEITNVEKIPTKDVAFNTNIAPITNNSNSRYTTTITATKTRFTNNNNSEEIIDVGDVTDFIN